MKSEAQPMTNMPSIDDDDAPSLEDVLGASYDEMSQRFREWESKCRPIARGLRNLEIIFLVMGKTKADMEAFESRYGFFEFFPKGGVDQLPD